MPYRATFIYITHKQTGLFPCTQTLQRVFGLPTATEQLWSVASINDISANVTQKRGRTKKRERVKEMAEKHR